MTRRILPLLVAVLAMSAFAQEARVGESIEVSIVNVEVHVTDKQGHRITGLSRDDFEIRENGKVQPITNFSEFRPPSGTGTVRVDVAGGDAKAPEAGRPAAPRARRSIVLFVEPLSLDSFRAAEFFDAMRALLHRTVEKGDQVAIVSFSRTMRIRQPLTDDMTAIDTTLGSLQKEMASLAGNRYDESAFVLEQAAVFEKEINEGRKELGMQSAAEKNDIPLSIIAAARRELFLIRQKTAALESLMQGMSGADGRKVVIMATRRYGQYAGAEFFGGLVPKEYRQEFDTAKYRNSLVRTANAHGITIYTLHPEGLQDTSLAGPWVSGNDHMETTLEQDLARMGRDNFVLLNESAILGEVAAATGGTSAWGSTNIAKLLPLVGDDMEAYYSLGYRATTTGKDSSRKIVVTTKNPAYVVRSRKELVEKSDLTQMKDRVRANLFQRVESSSAQIPFIAAVGKIRKTGRNRWTVPLKIRIPINSLTLLPRGAEEGGSFSVFFATGGVLGVMSDVEQRTQEFTIPRNDLAKAKQSYFTYDLEVNVDKLVQTMSVAVLDDVGREFGIRRYELPKEMKE